MTSVSVYKGFDRTSGSCSECGDSHAFQRIGSLEDRTSLRSFGRQVAQRSRYTGSEPLQDLVVPKECKCECHETHASELAETSHPYQFEPLRKAYDLASEKEGDKFVEVAKQYLGGQGKKLGKYMEETEKRKPYKISRIGRANLEDAIAAVSLRTDDADLIGSHDFEDKIQSVANHYQIPKAWAQEYILDHEHGHIYQKGIDFKSEIAQEYDNELTLAKYYGHMVKEEPRFASKYTALKEIANDRAKNVERNYPNPRAYSLN